MLTAFDSLQAGATGAWRGMHTLQDPSTGAPDAAPSTITVTPMLKGTFLRVDYTWSYRGERQEGAILLGVDPAAGQSHAYWIDSWHNGRKGMVCTGGLPDAAGLTLRGSYPAPPGPDWGWRLTITPPTADDPRLGLVMHNIWPESEGGKEELAVEAHYTRE